MQNPFLVETQQPLVGITGQRCGYIQLAPATETTHYGFLPQELFQAATDWAAILEAMGAKRVYWIMLSEVVSHLHLHLYPRWEETETKGLALFEQRDQPGQKKWTNEAIFALNRWAVQHHVHIIQP